MLRTFLALMLLSFSAGAQTDYLITSKADTLYGKVRVLTYDLIDRMQLESDKKKEMFTALQVLSINVGGEVYKPLKYENKIVLMKLLKSGYLSFYAFRLPSQNTYDGRFLVKLDGTTLDLPNIGFKKILSGYLEECESVAKQVKDGDLTKKDIDKIIDEYNACMANLKKIPTPIASQPVAINEKTVAIKALIKKLEGEEFSSKKDALDLLRDLQTKVGKNETIPNYLSEGLKSYLSSVPALTEDLNKLLDLLKK